MAKMPSPDVTGPAHATTFLEVDLDALAANYRLLAARAAPARCAAVVKADGYFLGLYSTQLAADEILTQIRIPVPPAGSGWSYQKLKRKTGDFATAATAVMLQMKGKSVAKAAIALTNAGPTPLKAREAEAYLAGKEINDASLNEAARLAMKICSPTPDQRGDADYKRAMCGEMTRRALQAAHARAKG